jgi:hypothetical protein
MSARGDQLREGLKELLHKPGFSKVKSFASPEFDNVGHRNIHPGPHRILPPCAIDPLYHRGPGQCTLTILQGEGEPPPATEAQRLQLLEMKTVLSKGTTFQALQGMVFHRLFSGLLATH